MIRVVARSSESVRLFKLRHEALLPHINFELGQTSYFRLVNNLIEGTDLPYVCLIHDDVTLGYDFASRIESLIGRLNRHWASWGLVGNAGVLSFQFGFDPTYVLRYLSDPHRGPNLQHEILPAQSIDGNIMMLNLYEMRQRGVILPDWNGFQLYDIVLSIQTLRAGLSVLLAPELSCWHDSGGAQKAFDQASRSDGFQDYLQSALVNRHIRTLNGGIDLPLRISDSGPGTRIDLDIANLRNATAARDPRTVAICVRTQFGRPLLLRRTLETIDAFIAAAGAATIFITYLLTDQVDRRDCVVPDHVAVLTMPPDGDTGDSRNRLIRFAAAVTDAQWFWFVDDDDWLFPNEAERLGLVLNVAPLRSTIFLDTQQFNEHVAEHKSAIGSGYRSSRRRYFPAREFALSLGGLNYIPMCGMLVSRQVLRAIPDAAYERVVYYEDFSILLHALLSQDALPIIIDKLFAGISIRDSGNSVNQSDRTKWELSMSNLVALITCEAPPAGVLTIPLPNSSPHAPARAFQFHQQIEPLLHLSGGERLILLLWRTCKGCAVLWLAPSLWRTRLADLITSGRKEGPRGIIRLIAYWGRKPAIPTSSKTPGDLKSNGNQT